MVWVCDKVLLKKFLFKIAQCFEIVAALQFKDDFNKIQVKQYAKQPFC